MSVIMTGIDPYPSPIESVPPSLAALSRLTEHVMRAAAQRVMICLSAGAEGGSARVGGGGGFGLSRLNLKGSKLGH